MSLSVQNMTSLEARISALIEAGIQLLQSEGASDSDVDILLADDERIRELNLAYRGIDKPTDVLSFSLQEAFEGEAISPRLEEVAKHLGDVAISLETAGRQAALHGVSLEQELALLTVHGILHLLGYEDETFEGSAEMRKREKDILNFSYPDFPFPE